MVGDHVFWISLSVKLDSIFMNQSQTFPLIDQTNYLTRYLKYVSALLQVLTKGATRCFGFFLPSNCCNLEG